MCFEEKLVQTLHQLATHLNEGEIRRRLCLFSSSVGPKYLTFLHVLGVELKLLRSVIFLKRKRR